MLLRIVCVLLLLLSASGCATSGLNNVCTDFGPIWLQDADVLSTETEMEIIIHNERWEAVCE